MPDNYNEDFKLTRVRLLKMVSLLTDMTLVESSVVLKKFLKKDAESRESGRMKDVLLICELLMNKRLSTREALEEAARQLNISIEA